MAGRTEAAPELGARSLLDVFDDTCDRHGGDPALVAADGGSTRTWTWSQYRDEAHALAVGLQRLGLKPGEHVALMLRNRPEHVILDLAALLAGGVPGSLYLELSPEQLAYVAEDCQAAVAVVEDAEMLRRWQQVWPRLPELRAVVVLDASAEPDASAAPGSDDRGTDGQVLDFEQLRAWGEHPSSEELETIEQVRGRMSLDDPATLIYTSGTTGPPKGAVITHRNVLFQLWALSQVFDLRAGDRVISYLPLAHIAERVVSHYLGVGHGLTVYFVADIDRLPATLQEARPQLLFGVPRVWEKLRSRLLAGVEESDSALQRRLVTAALTVGQRRAQLRLAGDRVPAGLRWRHAVLDRLVLQRIRSTLGLDRVRYVASGAAPLGPELMVFHAGIGLEVLDVYGLTETTAVASLNRPGDPRPGTVGRPPPGTQLRLADDGEVMVHGPHVFAGYHRRPEATREVIDADGWLHTGDLGSFDDDGRLRLTGRIKDLIVTSGGENVGPGVIEDAVRSRSPVIAHVCVVGDDRPHVAALIALDRDELGQWCRGRGIEPLEPAAAASHPDVVDEVARAVHEANEQLSRREQLERWRIVPDEWTIEGGQVTPSQKLRRAQVIADHPQLIEELYAGQP